MSQLKSNTPAFIETENYGKLRPKKKKLKRGVYVSTLDKKTKSPMTWKRVKGSFNKTLKGRA
mgnify:CR=1 FL=1